MIVRVFIDRATADASITTVFPTDPTTGCHCSLDPESFSDLNVLTELDLSHNLLTSLHIQLFSQLLGIQVN